ncbi:heavy-metal-associated domain-containing protein [Patiriisocius marinus]|uniref:HMA domain-containing protein n=1 Tax=Patiriisocius marinus TaxID=1397112 RepID=A0A5J4IY91_9FLAO|nr:heavy-metal-associated domain-containing protein [Patiriisocius marinus]GER59382.1 hypothetical protein ULMA_14900 [Patiriisocius marinus]
MKTDITVQNLKCGGCGNTITTRLAILQGISDIKVDPETSIVSFNYETEDDLALAEINLIKMGYPPEGVENKILSKAKSFVSCATGKFN